MTDPSRTTREDQIALLMTGAFLLGLVLVWAHDSARSDFGALYTAGYMLRHHEGPKLYDLFEQQRVQVAILGRHDVLPFLHPPFAALVFAPLAALPYTRAYLVWNAVNIALWIGFVVLMRRFLPVPQQIFRYFLVAFTFWPCWVVLRQGQTSLVILAVYGLTFAALREGHEFRAGAFLGLGLLKYQFVGPFVLICLLRRRWRMISGFALVGVVLAVVSTVVVGWSAFIAYVRLVLSVMRDPGVLAIQTEAWPSLGGLLGIMAGGPGKSWPRAAASVVSIVLIGVAAWLWRKEDQTEGGGSQSLAFAAAMAAGLAATPYIFFHDLSLLLLPLLLVIASPQWKQKSTWKWMLIASAVLLYIPPLWVLLVREGWLYWLCLPVLAFTVAVLVLLGGPSKGGLGGCSTLASQLAGSRAVEDP